MRISVDITISTDELIDDTSMESMLDALATELRQRQAAMVDAEIAAMESAMVAPLPIEPIDERLALWSWAVYADYSRWRVR